MAAPTVSFMSAGTVNHDVLGGLPDGYFVSYAGSSNSYRLSNVSAMNTSLGTVTLSTTNVNSAQNQAGDLYMTNRATGSGGADTSLIHVTQSGGTLSMTTVGTAVGLWPSGISHLSVSPDGSEVAAYQIASGPTYIVDVLSTTDASTVGSTTFGTAHGTIRALQAMGGGRVMAMCYGHSDIELWDVSTDTLLDSLAFPVTFSQAFPDPVRPFGTDQAFLAQGISGTESPVDLYVGVVSSAGDVLSVEWGSTYTTDWAHADVTNDAITATHGGYGVILPRSNFFGGTASIYATDSTGATTASSTTSLARGAFDRSLFFCGPDYLVYRDPFNSVIRSWSVTYPPATGPTLLRQRQSPKRTPSRVRGPDLRQRQTSFVT